MVSWKATNDKHNTIKQTIVAKYNLDVVKFETRI